MGDPQRVGGVHFIEVSGRPEPVLPALLLSPSGDVEQFHQTGNSQGGSVRSCEVFCTYRRPARARNVYKWNTPHMTSQTGIRRRERHTILNSATVAPFGDGRSGEPIYVYLF